MRKVSSKDAERQFFSLLKEADSAPVAIERHGRPRAALVSWRRFQLYEKILAHVAEDAALAEYEEALHKVASGRLGLGQRSLKKARALIAATDLCKGGGP